MLAFIGVLALVVCAFGFGAVLAMMGAYYKIEEHLGAVKAKQFLDFMRTK